MLFSLRILTLLVSLAVAAQSLAAELKGVASESQAAAAGSAQDRLFHKPGLIYFWALNDADRAHGGVDSAGWRGSPQVDQARSLGQLSEEVGD